MRKIMACLDVGNYMIKLVVGEKLNDKLNVLAVSSVLTTGFKNGYIRDEEAFYICLKDVLDKNKEMLGMDISSLYLSVGSHDACFSVNQGSLNIDEEKTITGEEIIGVLQDSIVNQVEVNMELVDVVPTSFKVDEDITANPKGKFGKELMVKSVISCVPKSRVDDIVQMLGRFNIDVLDITFSTVGDYYANKKDSYDDKIGVVINMGHENTTLSVFNKGVLTNTKVLELGGKNIDDDIAYAYKISLDDANKLKETYALAHTHSTNKNDYEIVTNNYGSEIKVNHHDLSSIVMERLSEVLNSIKNQINYLTKKEISYIIITGGLTECEDFSILLKEKFGTKVDLGRINEIGARDNMYSPAIGIINYYFYKMNLLEREYSIFDGVEQNDFSSASRRRNIDGSSLLGKLFGYFFDN